MRQVSIAKRRLVVQRLLDVLPWCLFVALAVVMVVLAVPTFRPIHFDHQSWTMVWLGVGIAAGLIAAVIRVWTSRICFLDAAVEIDRRFGLKERVSSTLSLTNAELETPAGQALALDTVGRVEGLEISTQFGLKFGWSHFFPMITLALVLTIANVMPSATGNTSSAAHAAAVTQNKPVRKIGENLKKRFAKYGQEANQVDWQDAKQLFAELARTAEKMALRQDADRKQGLVELHNMASELKRRREEIGSRAALRSQLEQLKDVSHGPADRLAEALVKRNFSQAKSELGKLQGQLGNADLNDEQRNNLQQQLDQLTELLEAIVQRQSETAQCRQDEIDQLVKRGDLGKAGQLQQQLNRLKLGGQLEQLSRLAQKLGDCSRCLREGDNVKAGEAWDGLMSQLDALDTETAEMEMLAGALDVIAAAKDSLNCKSCQGAGCSKCQKQGYGDGETPGLGMGGGRGVSDRPETETDTDFHESDVRGQPGFGKAVVVGMVSGPNQSGDAWEEIHSAIESSKSDTADPLTGQRLPRAHRESVRQYFDAFRQTE